MLLRAWYIRTFLYQPICVETPKSQLLQVFAIPPPGRPRDQGIRLSENPKLN